MKKAKLNNTSSDCKKLSDFLSMSEKEMLSIFEEMQAYNDQLTPEKQAALAGGDTSAKLADMAEFRRKFAEQKQIPKNEK